MEELFRILKEIRNNPESAKTEYVDSIRKFAEKVIGWREDWRDYGTTDEKYKTEEMIEPGDKDTFGRRCARATSELEILHRQCLMLVTWQELLGYYQNEEKQLKSEKSFFCVDKAIELMGRVYGNEARTVQGRALLSVLLREGIELEIQSDGTYHFKRDGKVLKGVIINDKGELEISPKIKKGIDTISKGAIAADMDVTTARRDENIDTEMLNHISRLMMLGIRYGVISANEFKKQFTRSVIEFIPLRLLYKCFVIYASGAGVKAKFNQKGDILPDEKYTRSFTEAQVEELNTFLTKLTYIWEEVVRVLRENVEKDEDRLTLNDIETVERKIKDRFAKEEIKDFNKDILDKYQVNILEILNENLMKILQDINEILNSSSKPEEGKDVRKEEKRLKYKKNLEAQLNPDNPEGELKDIGNWLFIDSRTNIGKDKIIQITLKPIYPAEKHIASKEDSAREILGNLIIEPVVKKINSLLLEIQPGLVLIEVTLGGSTSIDFARADINKSIAAEDLIKGARLEKERDLLLAIGDEFIFTGVDFAFLKTPKITVFSVEGTKDNKERQYEKGVKKEIEANCFWSGNYPELGGVGISATLGIYLMLEELYAEEVFRLFGGDKDIVPAIRRLRQRLEGSVDIDEGARRIADGGLEQVLFNKLRKLSRVENGITAKVGGLDVHGRKFTPNGRFFTPEGEYTDELSKFMDSLSDDKVREEIIAGIMYYDIRSEFWKNNLEFTV
ncbi:MAG: hypothetical protein KAJ14_11405, partial [Candidatus Omnitrophica bacterium]|nr:hypothetical protein [Candidatus Omnitrophota bacterium]